MFGPLSNEIVRCLYQAAPPVFFFVTKIDKFCMFVPVVLFPFKWFLLKIADDIVSVSTLTAWETSNSRLLGQVISVFGNVLACALLTTWDSLIFSGSSFYACLTLAVAVSPGLLTYVSIEIRAGLTCPPRKCRNENPGAYTWFPVQLESLIIQWIWVWFSRSQEAIHDMWCSLWLGWTKSSWFDQTIKTVKLPFSLPWCTLINSAAVSECSFRTEVSTNNELTIQKEVVQILSWPAWTTLWSLGSMLWMLHSMKGEPDRSSMERFLTAPNQMRTCSSSHQLLLILIEQS